MVKGVNMNHAMYADLQKWSDPSAVRRLTEEVSAADALAGLQASIDDITNAVDQGWVMFGGVLVFFMHAGFIMVESGLVRRKNTLNIVLKNVANICVGGIMWWLTGYGLAFGKKSDGE